MLKKLICLYLSFCLVSSTTLPMNNSISKKKMLLISVVSLALSGYCFYKLINSDTQNDLSTNISNSELKLHREADDNFCQTLFDALIKFPQIKSRLDSKSIYVEDLQRNINRLIYPELGITLLILIARKLEVWEQSPWFIQFLLENGADPFLRIPANEFTQIQIPELIGMDAKEIAELSGNFVMAEVLDEHMSRASNLYQLKNLVFPYKNLINNLNLHM